MTKSFLLLFAGIEPYNWEDPSRIVPAPPEAENGPFTEIKLAPSPGAAVVSAVLYLRKTSRDRSILQILGDVKGAAIYRVHAPGVRIYDGRRDPRLTGGVVGLRTEGEAAQERLGDRAPATVGGGSDESERHGLSAPWEAIDNSFEKKVAAVEMPDDGVHPTLKMHWTLLGLVPRLDLLTKDGPFRLEYIGKASIGWRDLWRTRDLRGRKVGPRFFYLLGRDTMHHAISLTRTRGVRDWIQLILGTIASFGVLGGALQWLFDHLL